VKFDVLFGTPGDATLAASLSPSDVNPSNDMQTETVRVKDGKHEDDEE
jgi:hypothetical protein